MPDPCLEGRDVDTRAPARAGSGGLLADISQAFVQLYKDYYGKGPTKARTVVSGDLVVCLLEGGFMKGEKTLRDAGRGATVTDQREALQVVLRQRFIDTIEELTERKVATFISGVDLDTETNAELFVLEPLALETGDERDALGAWAKQTRQQSRALRDEQSTLRAQQARLRQQSATRRDEGSQPAPGA